MQSICLIQPVPDEYFIRVADGYRKDREEYVNKLSGHPLDVDAHFAMVFHEWPDEDGVLLLKEAGVSVSQAKRELHPKVHKHLDMAVEKYGEQRIVESTVLLKSVKQSEALNEVRKFNQ